MMIDSRFYIFRFFPANFNASHKFCTFLFLIIALCANESKAQNALLEKNITIKKGNKNIIEIIEEVRAISGVEFSYSKDIVNENIIRSIDAANKTIKNVLDEILYDTGLKYKVINRHIIIYKPKGYKTRQGEKLKIITVYDTIITIHHDTIITMKYDTIINQVYHHDTISLYDTIKIQQEKPYHWFGSLHTGMFWIPSYTMKHELNNKTTDYHFTSDVNYSLGTNFGVDYKHFTFITGAGFTSLRNKNNYNIREYETDTAYNYEYTGGCWDKELIVRYYEWDGQDTIWINVYDSTYIPVDSSVISTNIDTSINTQNKKCYNKYSIIEIPFIVGYHTQIKKVKIMVKGGILAGYIINSKGKTYNDGRFTDINALMQHKFLFSFTGSFGIGYGLNQKISIFADVHYRKQLVSNYAEKMIFYRKPECFGVRFGAKYTFKR